MQKLNNIYLQRAHLCGLFFISHRLEHTSPDGALI
jgi:hypothetical protein